MTLSTDKLWTRMLVITTVAAASVALSGCQGNVFSLKVGDCLLSSSATADNSEVSDVPVVGCDKAHESEIFASILMDDGDFPGADEATKQAETGCVDAFKEYVGIAYEDSKLGINYFTPTQDTWDTGDREILCILLDPKNKTTGSLKDAKV